VDSTKLADILKYLGDHIKGNGLSLKLNSSAIFDIINDQAEKFQNFKTKVSSEWEEFKRRNQNRIIKRTYTAFFYQNFHHYFKSFINDFCGFNEKSLLLLIKEKVSDDNLFLEYTYSLSEEEERNFYNLSKKLEDHLDGITSPSGYLYLIVSILGLILRKLIQEKFHIILDAAVLSNGEKQNKLTFLIIIKNSKDLMFKNYYSMFLYYFLKHFKGIPEDYYTQLLNGRERLYNTALEEYPLAKEKLVDLLYYFYKKCNLLQNLSPILDFLNFVCARVEDSIYSQIDIIKRDFLANFDYTEEKKNALVRIFDFLDKKSTLYSTFQANNLPSPKSQFNLFLLYTKFYFGSGSLEALEVGNLLFLPGTFKSKLNQYNKKSNNTISAKTIKEIQEFLNEFAIISNLDDPNLCFYKIFNKSITQMNYNFFKTFLRSLNLKISGVIEKENQILTENSGNNTITFEIIIDHICRMLYTLIDKIFIRNDPSHASSNFIDPRSRYIGRNIALRVLELFIFQDLNVSDDVWPDYIISLNRQSLEKDLESYNINIPDKHFYDVEDIFRFVITYNFKTYSDQITFEEWLLNEVIIPLKNYIDKIRSIIENPKDKSEVYQKLSKYMMSDIPAAKKKKLKDFKFVYKQLASFWQENT